MIDDDDDYGLDDGPDEIEQLCQEALVMLEDEDPRGARQRAMEAVSLDDEHPFPMFVLGLIAEHEGDIPEARAMSELALRTAATNPDAIQLRVQVHLREGQFGEAEQLLRFGIVHNPEDADLHEGLARILLARGRHEDARLAADAALRLEPTSVGAHSVRTAVLEAHADRETMLAVLRQTSQLFPDDPYALVELAAAEAEYGNIARARTLLGRAHRIAPRDAAIDDVRAMVEGVHDQPLLRPLPRLLGWVREFPGSLPGFLLAFIVAALPLRELAVMNSAAMVPVTLVLGAWAAVALYVWVGPALAGMRVNRIAAGRSHEALLEELTTPGTVGRAPLDHLKVADCVGLLLAARRTRTAVDVLRAASTECPDPAGPELGRLADRLGGWRERALRGLLVMPGERRLLVAAAAAMLVVSPTTVPALGLPLALAWGSAAALLVAAWLLDRVERRAPRMLDESLRTIDALEVERRQLPSLN